MIHDNYNVVIVVSGHPVCFYSHTPPPSAVDIASIALTQLALAADLVAWPGDTVTIYDDDMTEAVTRTISTKNGRVITIDSVLPTGSGAPSWSRVAPPGLQADIVAGLPRRAVHCVTRTTAITWQTPDIGGFVAYKPIEVTLTGKGPDATSDDDPGRIFGRYDGGGWTSLLDDTLAADDATTLRLHSSPGAVYPRLVYEGQEAIAVSGVTAVGDGTYDLDIIERGAADTPPQTHEVQANQPPVYFTAAPTEWAQRGVSIWVAPIDAVGRQVGHLVERYVGEIDGKVKVGTSTVTFTVKPLTGVLSRAPATKEPDVIELARGVHRYERGVASALQVLHQSWTLDPVTLVETQVRRAVTAALHDDDESDFITLAWPGEVLQRINTKLETGRTDEADADLDDEGAHIRITVGLDAVQLERSADAVSDRARVCFASDPANFGRGRDPALPAPTVGGHISAEEQLRYGIDLSPDGIGRDPVGGGPDARWQHNTEEMDGGRDIDMGYGRGPMPIEAYHDRREGGLLTTAGVSSIPAGGAEMLLRYVDHNGEPQETPFRVLTSTDLGDGTHWLTIDPTTRLPSFGQRDTETRAQIMRAAYAADLPFSQFVLEVLGSGTGTGALGVHDVHVDGAGVAGSRLNADSFNGIRLPGSFGTISGSALRDPTKQLRQILRLAGVAIGIDTGPDSRARLSAFRLEAARPDLSRATLNVDAVFAPSGDSGLPMEVLPQSLNTLSIKVADGEGNERDVVVVNNRGINAANRQAFHLGEQPDGEEADIDLTAVKMRSVGDITAAILPLATRLFLLVGEGRRRWTLGVNTAAFDVTALRPYDVIGLTSNLIRNETGAFGVTDLPVRVVSVTTPLLDGLAQVVVEDAAATGVGWNVSARITGVAGNDVTISPTQYVDEYSPATGLPQTAVDQFEVGETYAIWKAADIDGAVEREVTAINGNVITFDGAPPAMSAPGWGVVAAPVYASGSAAVRALAYLGGDDAAGTVSGAVVAGSIT